MLKSWGNIFFPTIIAPVGGLLPHGRKECSSLTGIKMIFTNALSVYILQHEQNEIFEQNIRSIQETMRSD